MLRLLVSFATILAVTASDCSVFTNTIKTCEEPAWAGEGNCMLAVKTNGGTCNQYCQSQGSTCIRAQDNTRGDVCKRDTSHAEGCDEKWGDQLCVCADPCAGYTNFIKGCHDEPNWAGVGNCAMAVKTNGKTCNDYCESQGAVCARAQDNTRGNVCVRDLHHTEGCNESWGDQICVCTRNDGFEASLGSLIDGLHEPAFLLPCPKDCETWMEMGYSKAQLISYGYSECNMCADMCNCKKYIDMGYSCETLEKEYHMDCKSCAFECLPPPMMVIG